jgi:hypothetical protein
MSVSVQCERCGAIGERGDQPGEGKIVSGGGETRLGQWARSLLCDECADAILNPTLPGCTCARFRDGNPHLMDCDANH